MTLKLLSIKSMSLTLGLAFLTLFALSQCSGIPNLSKEELADPDALLDKGRELFLEEEYKAAIYVFNILLKKHPKRTYHCAWAQYEIGMCYYLLKDFVKAKEAFMKVRQKYPLPRQPRILAQYLIKKIDKKDTHKRSSYIDD